jgi:hypothetical protein
MPAIIIQRSATLYYLKLIENPAKQANHMPMIFLSSSTSFALLISAFTSLAAARFKVWPND